MRYKQKVWSEYCKKSIDQLLIMKGEENKEIFGFKTSTN